MTSDLILATAGYDHVIRFWDASSGLTKTSIEFPNTQVNKMTLSNDGKYLAVAAHNLVKVFDLSPESFASEVQYEGHTGNITAIGFQSENKWFFTASEDATLKIFDFKKTGFMRNFENNSVMVNTAVLHSN